MNNYIHIWMACVLAVWLVAFGSAWFWDKLVESTKELTHWSSYKEKTVWYQSSTLIKDTWKGDGVIREVSPECTDNIFDINNDGVSDINDHQPAVDGILWFTSVADDGTCNGQFISVALQIEWVEQGICCPEGSICDLTCNWVFSSSDIAYFSSYVRWTWTPDEICWIPVCEEGCLDCCGDWVLDADWVDNIPWTFDDEYCDDGNTIDGDGCNLVCEIEEELCEVIFWMEKSTNSWMDPIYSPTKENYLEMYNEGSEFKIWILSNWNEYIYDATDAWIYEPSWVRTIHTEVVSSWLWNTYDLRYDQLFEPRPNYEGDEQLSSVAFQHYAENENFPDHMDFRSGLGDASTWWFAYRLKDWVKFQLYQCE